jgi:hypothetical protein
MVVLALAPVCMAARALTAIVAAADIETMSLRIGSSWVVSRCHHHHRPRGPARSSVNPAMPVR